MRFHVEQANPLLVDAPLPLWGQIQAEHVTPAVTEVLQHNRAWLQGTLAQQDNLTWENLVLPLQLANDRLEKTWAPVSHLNAVCNTPALREAYNANLPLLSDYHTEVGQNAALYAALRTIRANADALDAAQRKALDDTLRNFELSGVALPEAQKARFRAVSQELAQLSARFADNVLDATNAWHKQVTDPQQLAGLPPSAMALLAQYARERGLDGWMLTLQFPCYWAVMAYADNRTLRAELYRAYTTRASELGADLAWDNSAVMRDILRLRQEEAHLLGYGNYAELSLATKMAENPQQVLDFLYELAAKGKPFAERDFAELCDFAAGLGISKVEAWDIAYVAEKMKQARFGFSEEDLKPYFPVERVVQGLFALVQRLFGVRMVEQSGAEVWHPDVRLYRVYDRQGELRAYFYLDLYARANKRGGAWMDSYCGRFRRPDGLQLPVAFMTCNASPPVDGQPALFTHDEVVTLFHEFGHGLHHMLTQVDCPEVAGINGVEWDAVELPSQFMENWCWERPVLDELAAHWQTSAPLPEDLFRKMLAARHFQAGMALVRQLEFALFDLHLHMDADAAVPGRLEAILAAVRQQVAVVPYPAYNRMAHSFSHIFAGGYAAGYYSYKWAEVLSADAFARFEEEGFAPSVGDAFLREILAVGGSRPALESFVAFRGRSPQVDALLRHSGLVAA